MIKISARGSAAVFFVRVSPGADRNRILGEHDGALKVAVSAPPERGKANKALIAYLAKMLGVKKGDLQIAAGETSRTKRVELAGISCSVLQAKLIAIVEG